MEVGRKGSSRTDSAARPRPGVVASARGSRFVTSRIPVRGPPRVGHFRAGPRSALECFRGTASRLRSGPASAFSAYPWMHTLGRCPFLADVDARVPMKRSCARCNYEKGSHLLPWIVPWCCARSDIKDVGRHVPALAGTSRHRRHRARGSRFVASPILVRALPCVGYFRAGESENSPRPTGHGYKGRGGAVPAAAQIMYCAHTMDRR